MSGVSWSSSPADMAKRVADYGKRLVKAIYALASEWTRKLVEEMKSTHPWTNRTGDAEEKLFGRVVRIAAGAMIVLGHGVDYGIYLETIYAGRWAVIMPTLQRNQAEILSTLQQLVR